MNRDREHLKLLALFHYIMAGLIAVGATFGLLYVVMGVVMVNAPPIPTPPGQPPPPPGVAAFPVFMGWFFIVFGGGVVVLGYTMAALVVTAGRCLARHRRWLFCLVIACILCVNAPMGTVLGVFTLLVLLRPGVKEMFAGNFRSGDPEEDEEYHDARPVQPRRPLPDDDDRIFGPRRDQP